VARRTARESGEDASCPLLEILPSVERERVAEAWRRVIGSGSELYVELRLRREPDGTDRWQLMRAGDVEERKRDELLLAELAQRAESARAEAEAANRMKDQFLATVSHELRTPLNAIFGWVRLLRADGMGRADMDKALETIERHARIQTQLVEDLLDVSRIVSGKLRLDPRPLHLADVVRAAIEATRLTAEAKGVVLEASIDPLPCRVTGDPNRLEQVVWNLLANAIKFTPKGGRVDVAVRLEGTRAAVEVADTGHGIEPDFLPFVFDRFRQADSSTRRQQGGLGLGLAIVRHIVELHGGEVEVDSPGYGQGARFTVRLPLGAVGEPVAPPSQPSVEREPSGDLRGLSVVVVDDDDDARELIAKALSVAGANVTSCASAAEALEVVRTGAPDVLVSDIGMPGENGYDLIRRIRQLPDRRGAIAAIALTGFARSEDTVEAARAGFQAHLAKPVDPTHLRATVHRLAAAQKMLWSNPPRSSAL
jgi:signal transduction histidine kinase/ActR/RegA family two-component response regulator